MDGPLCYCNNIKRLFKKLVEHHKASEWHLFLHSSKKSLKAVFLHNGKIKQSVPVAHSMHLKDSYESIEILLNVLPYNYYK